MKWNMKSTIEEFDNYTIIRLNGQFVGGEETDKLFASVNSVMKKEKNNLIMDFENVIYFSSIVIGQLIKTHRDFLEAGGKMFIYNLNTTLKEVFRITKVSSFVTIVDNLDEAISKFK